MTQSAQNIITIRLSEALATQVRSLAQRDDERQSVIVRRLLRLGLLEQQRQVVTTSGDR